MNIFRRFPLVLIAILFSASGYAREPKATTPPLFYPLPPDEPRIQFLTGISSERDMQGERKFFDFIVGVDRMVRGIEKPYGIAAGPGKYYICDTDASVVEIADFKKRKLNFFQPGAEGALAMPVNIAVDTDGTRYVTDNGRNMVLVYNGDNYAGGIGKKDEMKPGGVALAKSRVYVTDLQNHCVRVYDKASRNLLFTFPKPGADKKATLFSPTNVAIDPQGNVCVCDTGAFCVDIFDSDGNFLRTFGGIGLRPGLFSRPKGIAVDRQGLIYVVDASTELIQVFNPQGQVLMYFGGPERGAATLPAGITIDYDNVGQFQRYVAPGFKVDYLVLVANQTGPNKISVFGFGHKK